jgi:hypothetical protein
MGRSEGKSYGCRFDGGTRTGAFQGRANLASGQSIGSLGTSASETPPLTYAGSTCATSFPTSVGIGSPASRPVFDIDFDGFANVGESFGTAIAVAQAPWKRRDADGRTAIGLLFQDHGVAQSRFPGPA